MKKTKKPKGKLTAASAEKIRQKADAILKIGPSGSSAGTAY